MRSPSTSVRAEIRAGKREEVIAAERRLAPRLAPAGVVPVAESGIFTYDDVQRLEAAGAHAVLVGAALLREPDVGFVLLRLRGRS